MDTIAANANPECFSTILTAHIYTAHMCPAKAATEQQQEYSGPHSTTVLYPDSDSEHARRNALFVDFCGHITKSNYALYR